MEQKSEQLLKKRKFLLMLPLLVLPFLLLGFWALGGGKGAGDADRSVQGGINMSLPGAKFNSDKPKDKFSLYEQRKVDSAGLKEAGSFVKGLGFDTAKVFGRGKYSMGNGSGNGGVSSNEAKIGEKLAEIRKVMSAPEKRADAPVGGMGSVNPVSGLPGAVPETAETERLRKMMEAMKQDASAPDPELIQLNGMMDKILKIQHPEAVGMEKGVKRVEADSAFKAIPAVIDGNQKVLPGGLVRLRLSDSVRVHGVLFLKGQSLSGFGTVTNQRLLLDIKSVRLGTSIVPVSLTVFSLDGLAGMDAPEAELGETVGSGAAGALDNMELLGMDQSVGMQAATAGITAAKGLLRKKARQVRVKLHGGQVILLRVNKS